MAFHQNRNERRRRAQPHADTLKRFVNETYERRIKAWEVWNEDYLSTQDLKYRLLTRLNPDSATLEWEEHTDRQIDPGMIKISTPENWHQTFQEYQLNDERIIQQQQAIKVEYDTWYREYLDEKEQEFLDLRAELLRKGLRMHAIKRVDGSDNEEIPMLKMLDDTIGELRQFKARLCFLRTDLQGRRREEMPDVMLGDPDDESDVGEEP